MIPHRLLAVLLAAAALPAAAGCGGGDDAAPPPRTAAAPAAQEGRPVTDEQALVLARLLQQNWEQRGATFRGVVPVAGMRIPMRGRVDFRSGRGTATLREPNAASRRYVWTRNAVYAQEQPGAKRYVVETPNAKGDPIHQMIAFVNLLSAETIDNTANIKDQGARFLRGETLDGTPVDVYDYGDNSRTRYWVQRESGLLHQVEATFPEQGTLDIELLDRGPQQIALPPVARAG